MKKILFLLFSTILILSGFSQQKAVSIIEFGANADGKTLNTIAIQKAIDKVADVGGGKVIVPTGRFVTGVIHLKTGVELHLQEGAALLGSTNRLDYGKEKVSALITAENQHHISITGKGEIDGRGREVVKDLLKLLQEGVLKDNDWKIKRPHEYNRPKLIEFRECNDVTVRGILIRNAATWVQDYIRCNRVTIDSITVISTEYWNNDGIDISNSKNVSITNCDIDAADDAICLKSEGYYMDSCVNIFISNCRLRSSASAFKIGTASEGGFRNIKIRNLEIFNTYRSAIALEAVDGAFLEDVDIQQVRAVNTGNAILIRLGHRNTDSRYSSIKNIKIADVQVEVPARKPDIGYPLEGPVKNFLHNVFPSSITGLPGHAVENVTLKNITVAYEGGASKEKAFFGWDTLHHVPENAAGYPEFSMFGELPAWALYARHVKGLTMENVEFKLQNGDYRPACIFDDANGLYLNGVAISSVAMEPVLILNNVRGQDFKKLSLPVDEKRGIKIVQLQ